MSEQKRENEKTVIMKNGPAMVGAESTSWFFRRFTYVLLVKDFSRLQWTILQYRDSHTKYVINSYSAGDALAWNIQYSAAENKSALFTMDDMVRRKHWQNVY